MFCPSSCVFVYSCLGKDFVMAMLCCLYWMTLQEDQIIEGPPIGDLSNGRRVLTSLSGLFLVKNSVSRSKFTDLSFFGHKNCSSV